MTDYRLILGENTYKLFSKVKNQIGQSSDSVTVAELCLFYSHNIERIEKQSIPIKLPPLKGTREPFKKREVVFVYLDNNLKRGKITGFTKGKIHVILDDGAILEHQPTEIIFHEWDVGYAPLLSSNQTAEKEP